ncbi:flavo protein pyridine nucleotide cytochrome reductase-like protein [Thermothelomyces thermophilus ATCC 42464]|uniref:Flavo protein pyridine nucleotide cytochrome reductase-like protein n=1 Tax=Thermothelomyces thermophilus (strain ATCC 42464 / BCRC 31852 / DSM 1799) TaxID=573729 RepID=G2QAX1_THET4|nr:flavo protein pyridine nucleotide cytochrome reductase-like protein [Thermothelomyces thermophilus ATCC 42464]AEO56763.1 flavo protein pyridine nucleotide cytochrome reductase-like protein [Thermothelomyces thermophilus ATCC 42464]
MATQIDRLLAEHSAASVPEEPHPGPSAAPSLTYSDSSDEHELEEPRQPEPRRRRASTRLIAQSPADVQRITGETTTQLIRRCCGGGCCLGLGRPKQDDVEIEQIEFPDNDAYRSLCLKIDQIPATLNSVCDLPEQTVFLQPLRRPSNVPSPTDSGVSLGADSPTAPAGDIEKRLHNLGLEDLDTRIQPPSFVQPHPPHHVFPARIHNARELTRPGAEKRTFHFDLDVTNYPEGEGVDFKVGGAIGVSAPNEASLVEEILDLLLVPRFLRDKPVLLRTTKGRWPTVWGDDKARELVTTRRDLLTWCSDVQSYPPTKQILRVLAEHATDANERKILLFLCSAEGQGVFCDFRTGPHITLVQLLHAFPSAKPPLDQLLSVLPPLMPRFYSLSNDPHESFLTRDGEQHRLIEIAVTVHETADWRTGKRTGVGSGFFQRQALRFLDAQARGERDPEFYIPMFKGLMANPLAKQFVTDGPMLLIGAGVGIAPFRGFVQRRLKTASCANKVWVLQGVRDSLVDELYSGEWGVHEDEVKKVVQSRRGEGRYVQEEVKAQADLVWYIINSVDGRVFVCGSSKGMGEGVEKALVEVAMIKGNLEREEAQTFWNLKKEAGQYIAETW